MKNEKWKMKSEKWKVKSEKWKVKNEGKEEKEDKGKRKRRKQYLTTNESLVKLVRRIIHEGMKRVNWEDILLGDSMEEVSLLGRWRMRVVIDGTLTVSVQQCYQSTVWNVLLKSGATLAWQKMRPKATWDSVNMIFVGWCLVFSK